MKCAIAFVGCLFVVSAANADLVFSVADAGGGTIHITLSGSGVTSATVGGGIAFFGINNTVHDFLGIPNNTAQSSVMGIWNIGGNTSDFGQLGTSSGADFLGVSFAADVSLGTDLSLAGGTVTFPVSFSSFQNLPTANLNVGPNTAPGFGNVTIQASAIPEPSAFFAVGLSAVCVFVWTTLKRNQGSKTT